jgi:hypothetical protein
MKFFISIKIFSTKEIPLKENFFVKCYITSMPEAKCAKHTKLQSVRYMKYNQGLCRNAALTWNEKAGSAAALASHTHSVSHLMKTNVNKPQGRKTKRKKGEQLNNNLSAELTEASFFTLLEPVFQIRIQEGASCPGDNGKMKNCHAWKSFVEGWCQPGDH